MYVGIAANVINGRSPDVIADKIRALGFSSIQFVPNEVVIGFGHDTDVPGTLEESAAAYRAAEIDVPIVGGYMNILHPDPIERRSKLELLKRYIRAAPAFGAQYVSTETGTYAQYDYDTNARNETSAALDDLRRVTDELLEVAVEEGVTLLYEPYIVNVCNSPQRAASFVREYDSTHLALLMDPANWYDAETARSDRVVPVLEAGFAAERGLFRVAHAKDVGPGSPGGSAPALPRAGQGILSYRRYVELLAGCGYDGPLILEHLDEDDVPETRDFVQGVLDDVLSHQPPVTP